MLSRTAGFALLLACFVVLGCKTDPDKDKKTTDKKTDNNKKGMGLTVQSEPFSEKEVDGKKIKQYHLTNSNGMVVSLITYGGIVTAVKVPDKAGNLANVTLGFDNLDDYLAGHPYFGATVGRYANRIAKGKFTLNGKEYTLATNNGPNHLHGGKKGFDKVVWDSAPVEEEDRVGVKLTYFSPDGEEGYPGGLKVTATYSLTEKNELVVEYEAVAEGDTVLNITNHCYWNLRTPQKGDIKEHVLKLNCKQYLETDKTLIPTGKLLDVSGTLFDFTKPKAIGTDLDKINLDDTVIGYDNCYVIADKFTPGEMRLAAVVKDPESGRVMEIRTDQPGIQFYTGNFMKKENKGEYGQHHAFCLETQHFPDSPNHKNFPTTVLKKGEVFRSKTVHTFKVEK